MTRISLAEEYDNRDMVAQMIALKNRQTESENNLLTYVAQCAQSAADADSAKDDAEAARDTAVAAATDTVRKTPAALQVITGYPLQSVMGFVGSLVGNATSANSATSATTASKLGSSTVGSVTKPIYLNGGTATLCNEMCDLSSAQTITAVKTYSASPTVPTVATGTADTKAANGQKVKNELDAYSPMVRTTGNQTIGGTKTYTGIQNYNQDIVRNSVNIHNLIVDTVNDKKVTDGTVWYSGRIRYYDSGGTEFGRFCFRVNANGTSTFGIEVLNSNGTFKFISLGTGDVI